MCERERETGRARERERKREIERASCPQTKVFEVCCQCAVNPLTSLPAGSSTPPPSLTIVVVSGVPPAQRLNDQEGQF